MKSIVKVKIGPFLGEVLDGNGQEIRKFRGLSSEEKNEILTETHQRSFLSEFLGAGCSWERAKLVKSGDKASNKQKKAKKEVNGGETGNVNMDNEVLSRVICLETKAKTTEVVKELVSVNRMVKIGDKFENVPGMELQDKKVKEPKATAEISFSFDSKNSVLNVVVLEVTAKDPKATASYRKDLEKAVKNAGEAVEVFYNLKNFVKSFIDTLHVHKLCYISGSEAVNMMRIYQNAKVAYPLFAKLDHRKQIDILDKGYRNSRSVSAGSRDIHAFAKGTFEAMCNEGGIIDQVYKHDFITNQMMTYYKIEEHRRDRRNPDNSSQIWEKNCLIFVDYVYGKVKVRTSLLAFDLWDLLARGVKNSEKTENSPVW